MLQRLFQRSHVIPTLPLRLGHRLEGDRLVVVLHILIEQQRVVALLLRLHLIPVFKSVQTHLRIVVGEVQIKVRRIEFPVDLLVNELCHRLIHILILTFIKMLFSKAGKHFTRPAFHMRYL